MSANKKTKRHKQALCVQHTNTCGLLLLLASSSSPPPWDLFASRLAGSSGGAAFKVLWIQSYLPGDTHAARLLNAPWRPLNAAYMNTDIQLRQPRPDKRAEAARVQNHPGILLTRPHQTTRYTESYNETHARPARRHG